MNKQLLWLGVIVTSAVMIAITTGSSTYIPASEATYKEFSGYYEAGLSCDQAYNQYQNNGIAMFVNYTHDTRKIKAKPIFSQYTYKLFDTKDGILMHEIWPAGNWVKNIKIGTEITLNGPDYFWPGSIYSSLITIHWELIIDATRTDGTRLKWIRPVTMSTNKSNLIIPVMPVRSGRIEVADY